METTHDSRMLEALRLTRAGEKQQAYQVLVDILKHDRDNFDAWMFMAQVTDNYEEAIYSIRQALRLRPNDQRAMRYRDNLLGEQASDAPTRKSTAPRWRLASLGIVGIIFVMAASGFILPRLGPQTPASEPGAVSDAQPVANIPPDCAVLVSAALKLSDQGCQQIGGSQVCYGHNAVRTQLVGGSTGTFEQPGDIVSVKDLELLASSPLDLQNEEWGVAVIRLEANLPGTLPGQLVTMLVFGDTTMQNVSGDMQSFYFTSGLGGLTCDAVPFDGILIRMAESAGFSFRTNGVDIILQGNAILQATTNESLTITILSGKGTVNALGQEQLIGSGQTLTVPLGGTSGLEASGPPNLPRPADARVFAAGCALTGSGCPAQLTPEDETTPTNGPTPAGGGPRKTSTPVPTITPVPTVEPSRPNDPPRPTAAPIPTLVAIPTNEPVPTDEPLPTEEPVPTAEPLPTDEPAPTNDPWSPRPTRRPQP